MSRPKLFVANWKSHKTLPEAQEWLQQFNAAVLSWPEAREVALCPSLPFVAALQQQLESLPQLVDHLFLGAQDCSPFPLGSYTGAVSAQQLIDLDVRYVIVGHSERRRYFHETDNEVALKVEQAVAAGLTPIVCLDEPYVVSQSQALSPELHAQCVVAYEPLSAIGNGDNQPVAEVAPVVELIHQHFGSVPVLYGGSVDHSNIHEYLSVTDGVIVGSASLQAEEFAAIVTSKML